MSAENNEQLSQQAVDSAKNAANRAAAPAKNLAKQGMKKVGKQAKAVAKKVGKKAIKAVGKAAVKIGKLMVQAVAKLIAALGPIGLIVLAAVCVVAITFNWLIDERGSSGQLSLDPDHENPTVVQDDGTRTAAALTEPQALIDAYYKYLSCDSHQKVYVDDAGNTHWLQFSDQDTTADFATLIDAYSKENYFYLSSYYIKMADELLHNNEFYYPEQIIKPVYAEVLPLENDSTKLYITALPIVDDGSGNAQALADDDDTTVPYAVDEDDVIETTDGSIPTREVSDSASKALIATSKTFEVKEVTLRDEAGDYVYVDSAGRYYEAGTQPSDAVIATSTEMSTDQTTTEESGVWDYGFGSILQYEPMNKEKYITHSKISFTIHTHKQEWVVSKDSEGNDTSHWGAATCYQEHTIEIAIGTDTVDSINNKIDVYEYCIENDVNVFVVARPSNEDLTTMLSTPDHVSMKVQLEDSSLAGRYFDDATLQDVFGNAEGYTASTDTVTKAYRYPLKMSVITSAATFSGNLRYEYQEETTTSELIAQTMTLAEVSARQPREGLSKFADCWIDNCTSIEYGGTSCFTGTVTRAGIVSDVHPSSVPTEISVPTGFQYIEEYASHYKIYVPNLIQNDLDFQDRINQPQSGEYKAELDADGNGELTTLDFLIKLGLLRPYSGSAIYASDSGAFSTGTLTADQQSIMASLGCSLDEEGEVRLLAKLIAAEAGPNKLDQLAVASVAVNRVYNSSFPNTLLGVISADGQYASWPDSVMSREPTEEMLESARQVLYGEFALPSNVVFQAGFTQGTGTYLVNVNGTGYYTHYYCYNGSSLSTTDIFGNPSKTEAEIRNLAEALHQQDVSNGISTSTTVSGLNVAVSASGDFSSDYALYAVSGFDVLTALRNMQNITTRETDIGLGDFISGTFATLADQISSFFSTIGHFLFGGTNRGDFVIPYNKNIALSDMRDIVIQSVTFSSQQTYSTSAELFDPDALQFIFIGKDGWSGFASGTNGVGGSWIPGTGSTFSGFTSPTTTHYNTSSSWNEVDGYAVVAIPSGTVLQAVGDGSVSSVTGSGPYTVKMTASVDGKSLTITYGNLASVSVSTGSSISKGDQIGTAGDGGMEFTLTVDGVNVDPMSYFYQPTFSTGAAFMNILNQNGYVDETLKNELFEALNAANVSPSGPYDKWHDPANRAIYHTKEVGQCTWWAYARGWQYCEQNGTLPAGGLASGYGNGGDYFDQGAADFEVGMEARAGAWIVWKKAGDYGHVAFVEAVTANGDVVYSESGSSIWYSGDGTGINLRTTTKSSGYAYGSAYTFAGFVYLDMPKS